MKCCQTLSLKEWWSDFPAGLGEVLFVLVETLLKVAGQDMFLPGVGHLNSTHLLHVSR